MGGAVVFWIGGGEGEVIPLPTQASFAGGQVPVEGTETDAIRIVMPPWGCDELRLEW